MARKKERILDREGWRRFREPSKIHLAGISEVIGLGASWWGTPWKGTPWWGTSWGGYTLGWTPWSCLCPLGLLLHPGRYTPGGSGAGRTAVASFIAERWATRDLPLDLGEHRPHVTLRVHLENKKGGHRGHVLVLK